MNTQPRAPAFLILRAFGRHSCHRSRRGQNSRRHLRALVYENARVPARTPRLRLARTPRSRTPRSRAHRDDDPECRTALTARATFGRSELRQRRCHGGAREAAPARDVPPCLAPHAARGRARHRVDAGATPPPRRIEHTRPVDASNLPRIGRAVATNIAVHVCATRLARGCNRGPAPTPLLARVLKPDVPPVRVAPDRCDGSP